SVLARARQTLAEKPALLIGAGGGNKTAENALARFALLARPHARNEASLADESRFRHGGVDLDVFTDGPLLHDDLDLFPAAEKWQGPLLEHLLLRLDPLLAETEPAGLR